MILSDAPQIEERPAVQCDAAQLDQGDSHWEGKLVEHHFANDIVAGRDDVPEEAHQQYDGNMTRSSPLAAQHCTNVFPILFLSVSVSAPPVSMPVRLPVSWSIILHLLYCIASCFKY